MLTKTSATKNIPKDETLSDLISKSSTTNSANICRYLTGFSEAKPNIPFTFDSIASNLQLVIDDNESVHKANEITESFNFIFSTFCKENNIGESITFRELSYSNDKLYFNERGLYFTMTFNTGLTRKSFNIHIAYEDILVLIYDKDLVLLANPASAFKMLKDSPERYKASVAKYMREEAIQKSTSIFKSNPDNSKFFNK